MKIAFSPCPNDTFVFHAWVHGLVKSAPSLEVTYADIDITNHLAMEENGPDLLKISYAALPWVLNHYDLIPCGGALGRGCGPLVLVANGQGIDPQTLSNQKIAVPSRQSTAYLLFQLWAEQKIPNGVGEIITLPFHEIMPAIRDGLVDAGLVIHEARFTYPRYGLREMADLGKWWEEETKLPIPLGAIIAKKSLHTESITEWIQSSVSYAWKHPNVSRDYILSHAQEMDPEVVQQHIDLYVNDFTLHLGDEGYASISSLLGKAMQAGLVPSFDLTKLTGSKKVTSQIYP